VTIAGAMEYGGEGGVQRLTRQEFEAFYEQTARPLRSYVCRIAGNAAAADDILQEAYVRLLVAPPMSAGHRKSYLYRTATNLVTDQWRAQGRARKWWQWGWQRTDAGAQEMELASDVGRLFQRIGPKERALLWLAYVEGAEHREIAAILQLKEKSVKVLLFRARRKMEGVLRAHGFGGSHE